MPYKDPQRKRDWEWQHRSQRLARRRGLRRIVAAGKDSEHQVFGRATREAQREAFGEASSLVPLVAVGVGGLTVAIAAIYKKGWRWWIVGVLMLALGLYFYWSGRNAEKHT